MADHETTEVLSLAAVVYGGGTDIDTVMAMFVAEIMGAQARVGGVMQVKIDGRMCGPNAPMLLKDVANGEILSISQDLGPCAESCRLDPDGLAQAAMRVRNAAESTDYDLVVISKFGKEEAAGRGFREELALAAATGRPVLTSVRRNLVQDWQEFTGGAGTLLEPKLPALRAWWSEVTAARVDA